MKRFFLFIISVFTQIILVAQTQYDYMDDDAVAGGADRALNGIIIIAVLVIAAIVLLFIISGLLNVYYWFNPKADPAFRHKIAAKEKERIRAKEKAINDKKQAVLDKEKNKYKSIMLWALMPLTRPIDTLVITLSNPDSEVGKILKCLATDYSDFVEWNIK